MRPLRGIALKVTSMMFFIVMASLIKAVADTVPPGQAVFFRSFFALPVILAWLLWQGELSTGLRTANPLGHFWRGLIGTTAMGLGFAGLAFLPLPEVTAIGFAAPILTVVFAAMFLGEQVRAFRLTAVGLGMLGVMIVIWPRLSLDADLGTGEALGAILVLMGAVFVALAQVFLRKLVNTETTPAIVFWFSVTASVLSLMTLPFGWVLPTAQQAAFLVLAGLLGGMGQVCLTASYREADVSVIAPFGYVQILFSLAIGYWVFAEVPTLPMLSGAALVIAAGVLIIWRERKLGLERAQPSKAGTPQG
ncbi:DMT family transporter [Rhodobacteraceae bacterium 2376]|uniref:DMT family transporter n=1 Tax=Rhabdonatronobacter sediminivivens TaxID=2743469 RepID=A0A7Z0HZA5_9RHOB|nr:DMT family transporter [Rhabdonatronobacter sediminivivens]NYS25044.1 DMT family transporter [Rhabdonatronobacter sediminivivens]